MDFIVKSSRGGVRKVSGEHFEQMILKMARELDSDRALALKFSQAMLDGNLDEVVRQEIERAQAQKEADPTGMLSSGTGLPRPGGRLDSKRLSTRKRGPGRMDTFLNGETH